MKKIYNYLSNSPALILSLCAGIFLLLGFDQDGINLDSATYAVIARNMAEFGSWFKPHYTDFYLSNFLHPPLAIWAQGLIFLFLEPNDSTARIIGAISALGCILTVYSIGILVKDKYFGFVCGLVLLLTYNFMQISNSTLLDTPMTFFVLIAILGLIRMDKKGISAGWSLITGAALGMAWLTKAIVAGPGGLALILFILIWRRDWLKKKSFWLLPTAALVLMLGHLTIDWIATDGNFARYYLQKQVIGRISSPSYEISIENFQAIKKYFELYLPFIVLIPFGIYRIIKSKIKSLYSVLIGLVLYLAFYSFTHIILYHYLIPMYALSAPIAALPVYQLMNTNKIRILSVGFLIIWLVAAVVVFTSGMRIHEVRTPELYLINDKMEKLLSDKATHYGVTIGDEKNWDWIAKSSWYWRSDLLYVGTIEEAVTLLKSGEFNYLLSDKRMGSINDSLTQFYSNEVKLEIENDYVAVFVTTEKADQDN